MKRCTVEGCDRKHWARGMCKSHYGRWWRTGEASGTIESRPSARIFAGESSWTPMPLAALPTYPRHVGAALHALAESNPSPERYEAEKARILSQEEA